MTKDSCRYATVMFAVQATIGGLVAKTLTTSSTNPYAQGGAGARAAPVALDVFSVQVTHTHQGKCCLQMCFCSGRRLIVAHHDEIIQEEVGFSLKGENKFVGARVGIWCSLSRPGRSSIIDLAPTCRYHCQQLSTFTCSKDISLKPSVAPHS